MSVWLAQPVDGEFIAILAAVMAAFLAGTWAGRRS